MASKERRGTFLGVAALLACAGAATAQVPTFTSMPVPFGNGTTICPIDYDGDGLLDLVKTPGPGGVLWRNLGGWSWIDATIGSGINASGLGATAVDFDGDGDIDLLFDGTMGGFFKNLLAETGTATFVNVSAALGFTGSNAPVRGQIWGDLDGDGDLDLYLGTISGDRLFLNQLVPTGTATFVDATASVLSPPPAPGAMPAFAGSTADFDQDGDLDLMILRGVTPNYFYKNLLREAGTFLLVESASAVGLADGLAGYACFFFDLETDGDLDLLYPRNSPLLPRYLYRNGGTGTFADVSGPAGLGSGGWHNGGAVWDFDLDGDEDLHIASFSGGNALLENREIPDGTLAFLDALPASGIGDGSGMSDIAADFDLDGDLDLVALGSGAYRSNLDPPGLANRHWLAVRLVGTVSNLEGIGARVNVVTADGVYRTREIAAGAGFGTARTTVPHFGLGSNAVAERVEIVWPSGIVQTLLAVPADQTLVVVETGPVRPYLYSWGSLKVGTSFTLRLRDAVPSTPIGVFLDLGDGPFTLPFVVGAVALDAILLFPLATALASGAGTFETAPIAVPNDPALVGSALYAQAFNLVGPAVLASTGVRLMVKPAVP